MTKPITLVLVHGAWHGPSSTWSKVIPLLSSSFNITTPELPSTLGNPDFGLADDVNKVHATIDSIIHNGQDVIVVGHSYGGLVGPSAIKGLTRPFNNADIGRVLGLVFVGSPQIPAGKSFVETLRDEKLPTPKLWAPDAEHNWANLTGDPKYFFYNDIDEAEQEQLVAELRPQTLKSVTEGGDASYPGWKDVPSVALLLKEDNVFPVDWMHKLGDKAVADGGNLDIWDISGGHVVMVSQPEEFVAKINVAVDVIKKKTIKT